MDKFKILHDRVLTAQAQVETVRTAINEALALGTPEGEEQALALETSLDQATAEEAKWHALYDKVVTSSKTTNPLTAFVPLEAKDIPEENSKGNTMTRADWSALNYADREKFIKAGGTLVD